MDAHRDDDDEHQHSSTVLHNKAQVNHINACYDEIRAKYFDKSRPGKDPLAPVTLRAQPASTEDPSTHPFSRLSIHEFLLSNDFLTSTQRRSNLPLPPDDPLLQARKQSNIKLSCMLSGYGLTTPFATHERALGGHDLFKFHPYHDVGKRKYDWNSTGTQQHRPFATMGGARPMSRSIDSFRRTSPPGRSDGRDSLPACHSLSCLDHETPVVSENVTGESRKSPLGNSICSRVSKGQGAEPIVASIIIGQNESLTVSERSCRRHGDPLANDALISIDILSERLARRVSLDLCRRIER